MKYEKMLTFTTKYNRHNVRYMGHLILKENEDPQAVMAKHRLAKQIESYEVSPLLPHAAIVVRMYQAYHGYYGRAMRRLDKDNRKGYFPKKRNRVERKMHQRKRETATEDRVFLLSASEAVRYFSSDDDRECKATAYAKEQGAYVKLGQCWWRLRSSGTRAGGVEQKYAARVDQYGRIDYEGIAVDNDACAIRPALWIEIPQ